MDKQLITGSPENRAQRIRTVTEHPVTCEKHKGAPLREIDEILDRLRRGVVIIGFTRQRHGARKIQFHLRVEVKRRIEDQIRAVAEAHAFVEIFQIGIDGERCAGENHRKRLRKKRRAQDIRNIQRGGIELDDIVSREGAAFFLRPVNVVRLFLRDEVTDGIAHGDTAVDLGAELRFEFLVFLFIGIVVKQFFKLFERSGKVIRKLSHAPYAHTMVGETFQSFFELPEEFVGEIVNF